MPILGVVASSISGSKAITGSYYSIQTATVDSGGASTITFSSIPSTYTHLQIRGICKSTSTSTSDNNALLVASLNSDTTYSNYRSHTLEGNGSSASAFTLQQSGFYIFSGDLTTSASSYADMFATTIIDILDYTNTNKYKTVRILRGNDKNGSGRVGLDSGLWMNTSAISNIVLSFTNSNLAQYSQFALYGVK